jgi:hypothetical protein
MKLHKQVKALLQAGDKANPRLWPAIVYPDPLLRQRRASSYSNGSAAEVQLCLASVLPSWDCAAWAVEMLVRHVGSRTPKYDAQIEQHSYGGF